MNYDQAAKEAPTNVFIEERWRFCGNFVLGRETRGIVQPSYCPYMTDEYGCIGCLKFKREG